MIGLWGRAGVFMSPYYGVTDLKRGHPFVVLGAVLFFGMGQSGCPTPTLPVTFRPAPTITPVNLVDGNLNVSFHADLAAYPDARSLNWEFGDGSSATNLNPASGQNISHLFLRSGTFRVRVHVFNASSRIGTGELSVTVRGPNRAPVAAFSVTDVSDGSGGTVPRARHFDASTSSDPDGTIGTFAWNFGDGSSGSGSPIDHTYITSGRYTVRLTVTDDRGGTGTTTQVVTANIAPTAAFSSTPSGPEAPPLLTVAFDGGASTDSDGSIDGYSWNFGDNTPAVIGQTPTHAFAIQGIYQVSLTVTDNLGWTAMITQPVDLRGTLPYVTSITPFDGEVDTTVSITNLAGGNFQNGAAVRLTRTGQADRPAGSIVVVSSEKITCSFDLTAAALGDWNVVVRNPGGAEATLPAGFRVVTGTRVRLSTSLGDIVLELDPVRAPGHVTNFLRYVEERKYDGVVFHRVLPSFVIQGGAYKSLGAGANPRLQEQASFPPITSEANNGNSNVRGTISLALRGTDANSGSNQFFINVVDNPGLDNSTPPFTVFGHVVEGLSVVDAIAGVPTATLTALNLDGTTQPFNNVPITDVTIFTARRE